MPGYRLSKAADADLVNILEYGLEHHGESSARAFYQELVNRFESISQNPEIYQNVNHIKTGYQRAVINSYSIFFIQRKEYIEISRVLRKVNPNL